jgi:hypothetical protein
MNCSVLCCTVNVYMLKSIRQRVQCDKHRNCTRGRCWNEIMCVTWSVRKLPYTTTLFVLQSKHESKPIVQSTFIFVFSLYLFSVNFCSLFRTKVMNRVFINNLSFTINYNFKCALDNNVSLLMDEYLWHRYVESSLKFTGLTELFNKSDGPASSGGALLFQ